MHRFILAFVLSLLAGVATAAETRVLLPIYFEQPTSGAYGSLWQLRFAMHNSSASPYIVAGCAPTENQGCPADLPGDEELLPNETESSLPVRYPRPANGVAGAVLYVGSGAASADLLNDLSFELRIADLSRSATSAGTEVPVVRESAFRTSHVDLLDIPSDLRFRSVLRVFEMNRGQAQFSVRIYDQTSGALLDDRVIMTATMPQGAMRFQPGFAEMVDVTQSGRFSPHPIRVEIRALTSSVAFWSYVSVTNNDSQQVTLVTPQ